MESAELYFRQLDKALAKENFLDKEMLDSDVHHLEVQGGFFDKLAVLTAGSLAVSITFIVSGFDHPSVQSALHENLDGVSISLILLLLSLVCCVIHNFRISIAVGLLNLQLEKLYWTAHTTRVFMQNHFNVPMTANDKEYATAKRLDDEATEFGRQKKSSLKLTAWIGYFGLFFMISGFASGLFEVQRIFGQATITQTVVAPSHSSSVK